MKRNPKTIYAVVNRLGDIEWANDRVLMDTNKAELRDFASDRLGESCWRKGFKIVAFDRREAKR